MLRKNLMNLVKRKKTELIIYILRTLSPAIASEFDAARSFLLK